MSATAAPCTWHAGSAALRRLPRAMPLRGATPCSAARSLGPSSLQHRRHPLCHQSPAEPRCRYMSGPRHAVAAAEPTSPAAAGKAAPVVIIGAGPAGLATSIMLARRGYTNIKVYERLPEPPAPDDLSVWGDFDTTSDRLYMIGINGRGQAVLRGLGAMERIDRFATKVAGRMDWTPGKPEPRRQIYSDRSYVTRCIQRDRLSACLLQEVRERYADVVTVRFGVACTDAEWGLASAAGMAGGDGTAHVCKLMLEKTGAADGGVCSPAPGEAEAWVEESCFVVGADGAGSAVRDALERASGGRVRVHRYPDTNVLVYRTIPLFLPDPPPGVVPGSPEDPWPRNLNYSSRTGSGINLDALPTPEGPHVAVVLYRPGCTALQQLNEAAAAETAAAAAGGGATSDPSDSPPGTRAAREFFASHFPMLLPLVRDADLARFAAKRDSSLPRFSYAGPLLHHVEGGQEQGQQHQQQGQQVQGSQGHSQPSGSGAACLVGDTIHTVKPYFGQGVNSAFEDVQVLSQALDATGDDVDRAVQRYSELRGPEAEALVDLSRSLDGGFLTFIGPLILDSLLHRLLPKVFSPNIISSLQNEQWRFSQIRERKKVDRAMQVVLLCAVALLAVFLLDKLVRFLAPAALQVLKALTKAA